MAYSLIASASGIANTTGDAIDTTGADLIVVGLVMFSDGLLVSDSKSNTWTPLTQRDNGVVDTRCRLFYCYSPTVGSGHTFSAEEGSAAIFVAAFSGAVASPFDQQNGAGTGTSGTSQASGSITPTENNELVVSLVGLGSTSSGITADAADNFTLLESVNGATGTNYGGGLSYQIQTTATARDHDWSWTGSSTRVAAIASFKTSASAQLLYPVQDISTGPWLTSEGSPAALFAMLDGDKSPDTDYCYTLSAGTMEVKFGPGSTPSSQTGHTLRYRLRGNGTTDALVKLKQGSTVIAQWTETNVPAVETDFSRTLDSSPSFTISDYTDLRISVEAIP